MLVNTFKTLINIAFSKPLAAGHSFTELARLTNLALKAKYHPWACTEMVKSLIGFIGRFRKKKEVIWVGS
jgi:hypothetical protein